MHLSRDTCAIPFMMKAHPKMEGGQRILYCEPSNESTDLEGERVLREALQESKDYFLAKGNFDLDHITLKGYQMPGIKNPRLFEIGRPTEVRFDENRTFVKGFVYSGIGETVEQANLFWDTLTKNVPPMMWYPSVGGHVRKAGKVSVGGNVVQAIQKVYWNNIGFAREPVNSTVPNISVIPIGTFGKSWIGVGSTLKYKAITAGYGTDHATLQGGAALREQSLDEEMAVYQPMTKLLYAMEQGQIDIAGPKLVPQDVILHLIRHEGLDRVTAEKVLKRFIYERLITKRRAMKGEQDYEAVNG